MSRNPSEFEELIDEIVWLANTREERGMTAGEVEEKLERRGVEASSRKIRYRLTEMADEGQLVRKQAPSRGSPGRPPMLYYHPEKYEELVDDAESYDEDDDVERLDAGDDVEYEVVGDRGDQTPRQEAEESDEAPTEFDLIDEIRRQHLNKSKFAEEIRATAPDLLDTDPRELLLDLAEWTTDAIESLSRDLVEAHRDNRIREETRLRSKLESLTRFVKWYFQRIFRVDYHPDGTDPILEVHPVSDLYDDDVDPEDIPSPTFDREGAESRLEERVFGESVLEVESVESVDAIAGADSSIAEISIPNPNDPLVRQTGIELYTGSAALEREGQAYTDYDFDPEALRRSGRRNAFKDGLMSSGRIRGLTDSELTKSRYAALDLRLYNQTSRVVQNRAQWEPVGDQGEFGESLLEPDIVYGDGRIVPLVHQISDYLSSGLYGALARNEMHRFAELMALVNDHNTLVDTVFGGVVKQSNLTWLAPLVFYYQEVVERGQGTPTSIDDIPDEIYQPPINDPVVAHLLADGLIQHADEVDADLNDEAVILTFRVQRRFYDQSLDYDRDIPVTFKLSGGRVDVNSEEDWQQYFEEFVEDRENRGHDTIDAEVFKPFRNLCRNVATIMTYAAPCGIYDDSDDTSHGVVLPRLEVGKAPPGPAEDEIKLAASAYAQTYHFDRAHAKEEYSTFQDAPVLVPSVIKKADEAAKFIRKGVGRRFEKEFRKQVQAAREQEEISE